MCLGLIKKDLYVVFRNNFGMTLVQMLFILLIISMNLGIAGYGVLVCAFGWNMMLNISANEKKDNTNVFLTALPYDRRDIIKSKYISLYLAFAASSLAYWLLSSITNALNINFFAPLSLNIVLIVLMGYTVFISISIPLYLKFDDIVVRVFSILFICGGGLSIGTMSGSEKLSKGISFIQENISVACVIIIAVSIFLSVRVSGKIFERLEF